MNQTRLCSSQIQTRRAFLTFHLTCNRTLDLCRFVPLSHPIQNSPVCQKTMCKRLPLLLMQLAWHPFHAIVKQRQCVPNSCLPQSRRTLVYLQHIRQFECKNFFFPLPFGCKVFCRKFFRGEFAPHCATLSVRGYRYRCVPLPLFSTNISTIAHFYRPPFSPFFFFISLRNPTCF